MHPLAQVRQRHEVVDSALDDRPPVDVEPARLRHAVRQLQRVAVASRAGLESHACVLALARRKPCAIQPLGHVEAVRAPLHAVVGDAAAPVAVHRQVQDLPPAPALGTHMREVVMQIEARRTPPWPPSRCRGPRTSERGPRCPRQVTGQASENKPSEGQMSRQTTPPNKRPRTDQRRHAGPRWRRRAPGASLTRRPGASTPGPWARTLLASPTR